MLQVGDWHRELWLGAGNATADAVRAALAHVRRLPHWDRTNGADHFMVFSYDRGARPAGERRPGACPASWVSPAGMGAMPPVRLTAAPHTEPGVLLLTPEALVLESHALASASVSGLLRPNRALRDGCEPERGGAGEVFRHTVIWRPGGQARSAPARRPVWMPVDENQLRLHASCRPSLAADISVQPGRVCGDALRGRHPPAPETSVCARRGGADAMLQALC